MRRQMLTRPRGVGSPPYALSAELAPEAVVERRRRGDKGRSGVSKADYPSV